MLRVRAARLWRRAAGSRCVSADTGSRPVSLRETLRALREGETTCEEVVRACFTRQRETRHLNAFVTVEAEEAAMQQARQADAQRARGEPAPLLAGMPLAVKSNLCMQGTLTTAASRMLVDFVAPYDATAVSRLRAAGALLLGNTNMDEFGMGSAGLYSVHGPTQHPSTAPDAGPDFLVPGGSSSGSAVAVATGACLGALGSDTGGSVRMPAAYCGVVGLKPTYGRIPRHGLISYASSLDTVGMFAASVGDCALLLDATAGPDGMDMTALALPPAQSFEAAVSDMERRVLEGSHPLQGVRVGVPAEFFVAELQEEVVAGWRSAVDALRAAGATIVSAACLPSVHHALSAYYVITPAEAASNLSRYDGVRYGHRAGAPGRTDVASVRVAFPLASEEAAAGSAGAQAEAVAAALAAFGGNRAQGLHELFTRSRSEGFGPEVQRRILVGTYVLTANAVSDYYEKALAVRQRVRSEFQAAFRDRWDVCITPAAPTPAFAASAPADPTTYYLNDVLTVPVNLAGLPAISVPAPRPPGALPVGMQLVGRHGDEAGLLAVARALELVQAGSGGCSSGSGSGSSSGSGCGSRGNSSSSSRGGGGARGSL